MALIVGTDTFATLAYATTYFTDRGNTAWTDQTDAAAEINLRKGADWVQRMFRFSGVPPVGQRLHFPAEGFRDAFGREVTSVPETVQEANVLVADIYREGVVDMEGIVTQDSAITKTKVDVIEVEYAESALLRGGAVLTHIYKLLAPITSQNKLLRA